MDIKIMNAFQSTRNLLLPGAGRARPTDIALFLLSAKELLANRMPATPIAGFMLQAMPLDGSEALASEGIRTARVIVIEIQPGVRDSIDHIQSLLDAAPHAKIVAAVRDASVSEVRALIRAGADDVIALPLAIEDLETTLNHFRDEIAREAGNRSGKGRVMVFLKSVGGVGTTAIATQMGCLLAEREAKTGREVCLIDLDVQFGNAAVYLGANASLSVRDLLEAGPRLDAALLRSAVVKHSSGLNIIGAPGEMMPLEAIDADSVWNIIALAAQEYGTVLVELPTNWTNWSLSLVAQSDLVMLISVLTVPSLRQTRRQLDTLRAQGLGDIPVRVLVNRHERSPFQPIDAKGAERALQRPIDHLIANDFATVSAAIDQGVPLTMIKAKNRVTRDLTAMLDTILEPAVKDAQ